MIRDILARVDRAVLYTQVAFWLIFFASLHDVVNDMINFGQIHQSNVEFSMQFVSGLITVAVIFYAVFKKVWEKTSAQWRTPVLIVLVLLLAYDAYIDLVVGSQNYDMITLFLDIMWLPLWFYLYKFPPLLKAR